jgi:hypothetical protein
MAQTYFSNANSRLDSSNPFPIATTQTHFSQALWEDPKQEAKIIKQVPLGRVGLVEDIAGAVCFLARFKICISFPRISSLNHSRPAPPERSRPLSVAGPHLFHCLVAVMMLIT